MCVAVSFVQAPIDLLIIFWDCLTYSILGWSGLAGKPQSIPTHTCCITHILTAVLCSQSTPARFLTGSIEEVSHQTGLGEAFLGMIVLPIAGNACEHITAIVVATKNKMDLALGVAVGSSIQVGYQQGSVTVCDCTGTCTHT